MDKKPETEEIRETETVKAEEPETQAEAAEEAVDPIDELNSEIADLQKQLNRPVVVEAEPLRNFVPAEEYHQHYLDKNPLGYCHLPPAILHDQKMPSLDQVIQAYPGLEKVL